MDVGEPTVARRYLEDYLNNNPGLSKAKVTFMARVGLYNRLYSELSSMDTERRNHFIRQNIEYFFPRDYKDQYEKAAALAGTDVAILFSITRQESGFDPFARSHADAFGLMQLLPEVAESVSKKTGIRYTEPEDLFQPEINIPLGAHFIQMLLRRFDGAFIPGVGSYNASENAIRGWIKTRYKDDPISFIEQIPYEETKSYVKLVMRNYIFYQMLISQDGKIDFPEYALQVLPNDGNSVQAANSPSAPQPTADGLPTGPSRFSGL
jgi:soluble lytic murein transglycosylase